MANFNYISIDTKAENIEKVANMEIVTSLLSENNTHEELPTAKAVFDTTQKVDKNVSKLEAKTDNGIESLSVWNTAKGGEKSLTVNDVSSLIHKCSLKLTSEDGNIYKLNNENFELYNPQTTFNYEIKENGILVLNGYTESQGIDALFYLKGLTIGEQYTFSILDAQGGFSPPHNIFYLNEDGSVGEPLENIVINNNYATFTPTKLANCVAVLRAGASAQEPLVNNVRYPQLVLSTAPVQKFLDFSAVKVYVNGQDEYTPNIDGTVTDIERYYPTMEITTNNQNVDISDFTYCVDTKKYIDNKKADKTEVDELKADISKVNNTTDNPITAGKVWTSKDDGAGWADIQADGGSESQFELIEEIVLTEAVSSIQRDKDPNGKNYNYKSIAVMLSDIPSDSPSGIIKFSFGTAENYNVFLMYLNAPTDSSRIAFAVCEKNGLIAKIKVGTPSVGAMIGPDNLDSRYSMVKDRDYSSLYLSKSNLNRTSLVGIGDYVIPTGAKIKIYGVRA